MASSGNVTRIDLGERELFIVGTAHVSQKSVEEVERTIAELRPDTVCVELDRMRHEALVADGRWQRLDLQGALSEGKALFLLVTLALSASQKKLGERLGVKPGAELLAAVHAAERVGAKLVLADRDIEATLRRSWRNMSLANKLRLSFMLVATPAALDQITEEQIEELKQRETVGGMLEELAKAMPRLKGTLIDERDRYLMSSIEGAPGKRIVAVVGAGHVSGMLTHVGEAIDRDELARIPPPGGLARAARYVKPALFVAATVGVVATRGPVGLAHAAFVWSTTTMGATAIAALIAGARPGSFVTATALAPLTALGPSHLAGTLAAKLEARLNPATTEERARVLGDMLSLKRARNNRFTRPLLVAALTGGGSALGGWVGVARLLIGL